MRESADELNWSGVTVSGRTLNSLRYAGDIVLIAALAGDLQQLIDRINEVSKKYGMQINAKKIMMTAAKQKININITCNGDVLEQVDTFRYLGALVTETGDGSKETVKRLGIARTTIKPLSLCLEG